MPLHTYPDAVGMLPYAETQILILLHRVLELMLYGTPVYLLGACDDCDSGALSQGLHSNYTKDFLGSLLLLQRHAAVHQPYRAAPEIDGQGRAERLPILQRLYPDQIPHLVEQHLLVQVGHHCTSQICGSRP